MAIEQRIGGAEFGQYFLVGHGFPCAPLVGAN
jgi:hypothetical protein